MRITRCRKSDNVKIRHGKILQVGAWNLKTSNIEAPYKQKLRSRKPIYLSFDFLTIRKDETLKKQKTGIRKN